MFHLTIKLTTEYPQEKVNFLDQNIKLIDVEIKKNLFVKHTHIHKFLDQTSCHPFHLEI